RAVRLSSWRCVEGSCDTNKNTNNSRGYQQIAAYCCEQADATNAGIYWIIWPPANKRERRRTAKWCPCPDPLRTILGRRSQWEPPSPPCVGCARLPRQAAKNIHAVPAAQVPPATSSRPRTVLSSTWTPVRDLPCRRTIPSASER